MHVAGFTMATYLTHTDSQLVFPLACFPIRLAHIQCPHPTSLVPPLHLLPPFLAVPSCTPCRRPYNIISARCAVMCVSRTSRRLPVYPGEQFFFFSSSSSSFAQFSLIGCCANFSYRLKVALTQRRSHSNLACTSQIVIRANR